MKINSMSKTEPSVVVEMPLSDFLAITKVAGKVGGKNIVRHALTRFYKLGNDLAEREGLDDDYDMTEYISKNIVRDQSAFWDSTEEFELD